MSALWGVLIGLGVALALQPLPVLAVVVLLSVDDGLRKAWAFFLGEFLVMFAIGAVTVALQVGTARHDASKPAALVTLAAGAVLLGAGAWLAGRMRCGSGLAEPGWLRKLDRMRPWPAFLLGAFLPTYLIAVAAGAHIVGTDPGTAAAVGGMLVVLVVGTSTVYGPIVLAQVAPERSRPARARLRDWLVRNWRGVGAALLVAVGAYLLAKGLVGVS